MQRLRITLEFEVPFEKEEEVIRQFDVAMYNAGLDKRMKGWKSERVERIGGSGKVI